MTDKTVTGIVNEDKDASGNGRMQWFGPRSMKPAWFTAPAIGCGLALLYDSFLCMRSMSLHHWFLPLLGALFTGFLGSVMSVAGAMTAYMLVKLPRTVPVDDLSKKLGVTEEDVQRSAEERGVKPPYSVNGRDFYRPEDFAAVSLLRSANVSAGPQQLLRAVASDAGRTVSDELLRASAASGTLPNAPATTSAKTGANEPDALLHVVGRSV